MDEQSHVKMLESGLRRWWIVLIAVVVTTALTVYWVGSKPAVYQASGTYVIQARSGAGDDSVRALEALVRGAQINSTYALIARSDAVRDPAIERVPGAGAGGPVDVDAEATTGTNAITVSATARDAETAQALAVAAGVETIEYVDSLGEPYELALLDSPELPDGPVDSRKSLTIAIGALLGLMLGLAAATIVDRMQATKHAPVNAPSGKRQAALELWSQQRRAGFGPPAATDAGRALGPGSVAIDADIGFALEATSDPSVRRIIAAASESGRTYSVGVLKVDNPNHNGDGNGVRLPALLHDHALANGSTLADLRDGLFAVVLRDVGAAGAGKLLEDWVATFDQLGEDDGGRDWGKIEFRVAIFEYGPGSSLLAGRATSISTEARPGANGTPTVAGEKRLVAEGWSVSTATSTSINAGAYGGPNRR